MNSSHRLLPVAALLSSLVASTAFAQGFDAPGLSGFRPEVPVSAFARPAGWFDPSRLQVSTTVSVGSGFTGSTDALQVTTLNYALAAPLKMQVSLGNQWGSGGSNSSNFFLEGLALDYRPSASTMIRIQYRNVRSPLQYGYGYGYGNGYDSRNGLWGGY